MIFLNHGFQSKHPVTSHFRFLNFFHSNFSTLKRTPLFDWHKMKGAKMVNFSGWEMPLEYSGQTALENAKHTRYECSFLLTFSLLEKSGRLNSSRKNVKNIVFSLRIQHILIDKN